MLANCIISWCSKGQTTVSLSSAESEYQAVAACVQEIMWIRQLLTEINLIKINKPTPILIWDDNRAAIELSHNDGNHQRTKHIDIKYHFIREAIRNQIIEINWIPSNHQLADILTKPLNKNQFNIFRNHIMSI
jgi:hypothetical protein